jgi:predicted kinase
VPTLIAMCGLSFSGKTTLAGAISEATGAPVVSYDELYASVDRDPSVTGLDEWWLITDLVCDQARSHLAAGRSVVVDNLNEQRVDRDRLRDVAVAEGAEVLVVHVEAPLEVIAQRRAENEVARARGTTTDEQFEFVRSRFEPPDDSERVVRYRLGDDLGRWLETFRAALDP